VTPARLSLPGGLGGKDTPAACGRASAGQTAMGHGLGDPHRDQAEDHLLASLLIDTWRLATGRMLRSDVSPAQLSGEELINFWADDHIVRDSGCRTSNGACSWTSGRRRGLRWERKLTGL
jgi:hypothetical protein